MAIALRDGDTATVTVTRQVPFGAFVTAPDGTPGLIRETGLTPGQQIDVRIDVVDRDAGRFSATRV